MTAVRCLLLLVLLIAVAPSIGQPPPGAYRPVSTNDKDVIKAARFAVRERSKTDKMTLVKILNAQAQVVAGMNYRLDLAVRVDNKLREADAVVWSKLDRTYELTEWRWRDTQTTPKSKPKRTPPEK